MKHLTFSAAIILSGATVFFTGTALRADLIYFPSEFNALYNEKKALEFELGLLRNQYRSEKNECEAKNSQLENHQRSLDEKLDNLEKSRAKDIEEYEKRLADLNKKIAILNKKSTNREQELLENAQKREGQYETTIAELKKNLLDEQNACIAKLEDTQNAHQKERTDFTTRIGTLTDELSDFKRLSQEQKKELERIGEQTKDLELKLKQEIDAGQIRLKRHHNRLIINIDDRISFASGSAKLKKEILSAIGKIAEIVAKYPQNKILIEGHTDDIPINTSTFPDNWSLSSARALSVLREILKNKTLDSRRFSSVGYGEFHPIVPNDTPENRALNRRVDIVVMIY